MPRNNLVCPHCGGAMDYLEDKKIYSCRYCDYQESEDINIDEEIERARKEERLSAKEEFLNEREKNLNAREYNERRSVSRPYTQTPISTSSRRRKNPAGHIIAALFGTILLLTLIGSCVGAIMTINRDNITTTYNNEKIAETESPKMEMDPFERLIVKVEGVNHKGKLKLSDELDGVRYEVSNDRNLSNGDVIKITANSYKYKLTREEFEYKVEELENLFQSKDEVTEENWEKIRTFSNNEVDRKTTGTDASIELTPYRLYMLTIDGENRFFDCYKAKLSFKGEEVTCYHVILHKNVKYANKKGKLIISEDQCKKYCPVLSLYSKNKTYFGAYFCFNTIKDFESRVEADFTTMDSFELIFENK